MKSYVQYHNTAKQGALQVDEGEFYMFAKKPIRHLMGQRVWLISGEGASSPKRYCLRYTFQVDRVEDGTPNKAYGSSGTLLKSGIPLDPFPWFAEFRKSQQNFSLGVREIGDAFLPLLEHLVLVARAP